MHYESWCSLTTEELARRDIAEVNLAAAFGLPGAGRLDIPACLAQLDDWAERVRDRTARSLPKWRTGPDSDLSESQFRMLVLTTVLQRDLGVKYYLPFNGGEYDARDSRNLFIHGILSGHGGTCATMPVLYTAIGRRLGYPLRLVMAKEHLFCRWEDSAGERFNIEATTRGFASYPDEHYLAWPKALTVDDLRRRPYLHSLSPCEVLADFIASRGVCLRDHLRLAEAANAFSWAAKLSPRDTAFQNEFAVARAMQRLLAVPGTEKTTGGSLPSFPSTTRREAGDWRVVHDAQRQFNRILRNRKRTDIEEPPDGTFDPGSISSARREDAAFVTTG